MTKVLFTGCLLIMAINSYAQSPADSLFNFNKKFTVAQLREDLQTLKDSLTIIHPALYRYTDKRRLDSAFHAAGKLINKPLTQAQFYGIAAPIISMIGDIHTTIEPAAETFNHLATQSELFPFDIRIIDKSVYIVSNNSSDTSIPVGSKILSINNEPIGRMLHKMKRYFSDEGFNETLQLKRVEQRFAFQYYLTYGYASTFTLKYSTGNRPAVTKQVVAQPFSVIRQHRIRNQAKYPNLRSLFPQPQQLFGFNIQQLANNSYTGKLYVLMDGLTTSAATQFASLVRQNKRGVLIGEDAPGSLYGGSGRGYSYFYLPHSGLLTMISQYRLYMTDPGKKVNDVVIIPDHTPQRSIRDTLSGKDKDLEYAEKLISATPGR